MGHLFIKLWLIQFWPQFQTGPHLENAKNETIFATKCAQNYHPKGVRYAKNDLFCSQSGQNCYATHTCTLHACAHLTLRYKIRRILYTNPEGICVTLRRSREEAEGWRPCDTKKKDVMLHKPFGVCVPDPKGVRLRSVT